MASFPGTFKSVGAGTKVDKTQVVGLLQDVGNLMLATTCPDLLHYRLTIRPILDRLIGDETSMVRLAVDRERLFDTVISFYKERQKTHTRFMVTFKTDGVEEDGMDGSGLRREFYSTFFRACLKENGMFVGSGRRLFPSNDMSTVQAGFFEALGRSIVASIFNGDCGFPYLAPAVFNYLVGADYTGDVALEEVPDGDIKELGIKLLKAKTDAKLLDIIVSASVIDHIGWPSGRAITMKTRDALVQQLVCWSMIDKRKVALDKLKDGLESMGFLQAMKEYSELRSLLVYSAEYSITAEYMKQRLRPLAKELKPKDDTHKKNSQTYFQAFIENLADETAVWLYQFITGSDIPAVEEVNISVEFNFNMKQKFPESTTCTSHLRIPVANRSSSDFNKSFMKALESSRYGFGNR